MSAPIAHVKVEFLAGTDIADACHEAIRCAALWGVVVNFDFNEVHMGVFPNSQQVDAVAAYHNATESKSQYKIGYAHAGTHADRQIQLHTKKKKARK